MSFCYKLDKDKLEEFTSYLESIKDVDGCVMPALQQCQNVFSYIPEPVVDLMALKLNVPSSEIYGVATFYSQFSLKPKGEHDICVCLGTACYVNGSDKILNSLSEELGVEVGDTTEDGKISLSEARCVGECGSSPVVMIDGEEFVEKVDPSQVHNIIHKVRKADL